MTFFQIIKKLFEKDTPELNPVCVATAAFTTGFEDCEYEAVHMVSFWENDDEDRWIEIDSSHLASTRDL